MPATAALGFLLCGCMLLFAPLALAAAPPTIEDTAVLDVAATSATFQAKINPEGTETTYRFEYGTSETYGSQIPIPDGIVGSGSSGLTVSAHIQELAPSTTYHYRAVALVASRDETVPGLDGTFTTQPAGSEFALPDGRQWELVSPPNKHGAQIFPLAVADQGVMQASEDGSAIAYLANVPMESDPQGYKIDTQIMSRREAQGWSSRDIDTPHSTATGLPSSPEYLFYTGDLSAGLVEPILNRSKVNTLLSSKASETTPYVRNETLCSSPATAKECYLPVVTGKEGFADVPPGTEFGRKTAEGALGGSGQNFVRFTGASPDLRHVILTSKVDLNETGGELYEWSAGVAPAQALQSVSVLPADEGGKAIQGGLDRSAGVGHGVSDDGSRVFWFTGNPYEGARLYMRDMLKQETVRIGNEANFQFASSDGSKVYFTEGSFESPDLYECEIIEEAGKLACKVTHIAGEAQPQLLGASEDGSYVYFVSGLELGEYHEGVTTFIAELSPEDEWDWGGPRGGGGGSAGEVTAQVSANGRYVAFMSARSLTGYDNRDVVNGKPDEEVYLYDAASKRLACASCDPTGGRPVGLEVGQFEPTFSGSGRGDIADVSIKTAGTIAYTNGTSVAANLPEGDILGSLPQGYSYHRPRLLFDSGRLLFNSIDALVPQDLNGNEDVYEFEFQGMGSCTAATATFSQQSGGCVSLISSGSSPEESGLFDASATGSDVFFMTESQLTSQDYDKAFDVYDAHECSASVPCVSPPVPSPSCDSGDACKAAPSPQPPIFGAPASETFKGSASTAPETHKAKVEPKTVKCGRGHVRRHQKCVKTKSKKSKARRNAKKSSRRSAR